MSKNKKKIIFGIVLIIVAIGLIALCVCMTNIIADATNIITIKQGFIFMGVILSSVLAVISFIGGVCMIADGLDIF